VLRDLLTTDGLLVSTGGALPDFLSAVPGGAPPGLSPELFSRMALPVAGDDRTAMTSELWWPDAASDELLQGFDGPVHRVGPITSETATLVMTLRVERSKVFPLHQLPLVAAQSAVPVASVTRGADEELEM